MLTVKEIRQKFLDFFRDKGHKIVPAAPIVNQNDPTLMFINSGMAQFKDAFLGNQPAVAPRVADTQKCLRVSGKHNDLEDVGMDGTHHTMFEMLGNWSFGDYFKKEAIAWSWELLTEVYGIPKDRLYASVFGGDSKDGVPADEDSEGIWAQFLPKDRILRFGKKENFWEMGDTGPCGPCTEIHVDLRSDEERAKTPGSSLVNVDNSGVVEIWNNVFMEFERRADGSLVKLAAQHVDTGMGLERLTLVLQNKKATYDTDAFTPLIHLTESLSGKKYEGSYERSAKKDIAFRVIADHIRAVSLVIADGQLPSNTGAGYVLRRVLRRAVRYYFSFLEVKEPLLHKLLPTVADMFDGVFPEVKAQLSFIQNVVRSEEENFLRTLSSGLRRIEELQITNNSLKGQDAFELYDTYGFPIDLTRLIAAEKGWVVDEAGFEAALKEQKDRSRRDAEKQAGDWVELQTNVTSEFVGYDQLETNAQVTKYRLVKVKNKEEYHLVLNQTPFYPEGGGQVGDVGTLYFGDEVVEVVDTKKENNLIIHYLKRLPEGIHRPVRAVVNEQRRRLTENNHSATHLLHAALRQVLGTHVQQKGSLVEPDALRFDFSHFQKMTDEEIRQVEDIVNRKIRENVSLREDRSIAIEEAKQAGAMMLFGEKYGETVRMITFDASYSRELCGGCHVPATGKIGLFKIKIETSIAAGVRRIEALTAEAAEAYVRAEIETLNAVRELLKNPVDVLKAVQQLQDSNKQLRNETEKFYALQATVAAKKLSENAVKMGNVSFVGGRVDVGSTDALKAIANEIHQTLPNAVVVTGADIDGKAQLSVAIPKELVDTLKLDAGKVIKAVASEIMGGGGGQSFYATAGGKNPAGIETAVSKAKDFIASQLG